MYYNRQFADVLAELARLPSNPTRDALTLSSTAALQSPAAAIERAGRLASNKSAALQVAGLQLLQLSLYGQASDLLSASIDGQSGSAAQVAQQIAIFRTLHPASLAPLPPTDPVAPVHLMLTSMLQGTLKDAAPRMLDRNAYATQAEWTKTLEHNDSAGYLHTLTRQAQLPLPVLRDLILDSASFSAHGDDQHGFLITMKSLGAPPSVLFVTHDAGAYRIVADAKDNAEVGKYTLYLIQHNRETEARSLLNWKRDQVRRGGGDDPFDGSLFARFWSVDSDQPASAIEIAALALTLEKPASQASLTAALAASAKDPDDQDLNLLLATAYLNHLDPTRARPYLDKLLTKAPNSITAIGLASREYELTGDQKSWSALLDARLARRPDDPGLLRQAARQAEFAGDFSAARKHLNHIIDSGKSTASDYNSLAWLGLFDNHLDQPTMDAAQQAVSLSKRNFASLHTQACLYAAQGKTTEARQLLLDAMNSSNQAEPNPEVWFGFASIYEQYGAVDAAIAAYNKVPKPEDGPPDPTSTYTLAQSRLKALRRLA